MSASAELRAEYDARVASQGPDHLDTLQVLSNLVATLIREQNYGEALMLSEHLIEARTRAQGPGRVDTIKARRNRTLALGLSGHAESALAEVESLLPVAIHSIGLNHSLTQQIRDDRSRWRSTLGLPEREAPSAPRDGANAAEEPPTEGRALRNAALIGEMTRDFGIETRMKDSNSESGWSPEERRAVYQAMGKDYRAVDVEQQAAALFAQGSYREALPLLDDAIRRLRTVYARDGLNIMRSRLRRGICLLRVGREREGRSELEDLRRYAVGVLAPGHDFIREVERALGSSHGNGGTDPLSNLIAIVPEGDFVPPPYLTPELIARSNAAVEKGAFGNWAEAYAELSSILRDAAHVPADDEWLLHQRYNQAMALGKSGDLEGAALLLDAVQDDMEAALGPAAPDTLDTMLGLAYLRHELGEFAAAIELMTQVRDRATAAAGPSSKHADDAEQALRTWDRPRRRFRFGL